MRLIIDANPVLAFGMFVLIFICFAVIAAVCVLLFRYKRRNRELLYYQEQLEEQRNQLLTEQQNLQSVLDVLPIPVRIVEQKGQTITYANNEYIKLFDYMCKEEAQGQPISVTMPEYQRDGMLSSDKIIQMKNMSKPFSMELEYRSMKGNNIEALLNTVKIDLNGNRSSVGIIRDLAEEKESKRMLMEAAVKEKEANELKSRFLVNMSHEIRTPMNAIIGLAEIELRKQLPKETAVIYKKISNSAKHLLNIINDILDISKIEADEIELVNEQTELEEVVNSAIMVATPRLEEKNVEFVLKMSLDLPRYVICDKTKLWQIIKNILDNAAKFTEKGKILLNVFADTVLSDEETIYVSFIVGDTGIGIDSDKINEIFLPYKQIYNKAQRTYSGTGLGMPISKRLCELMNGTMAVESRPGVGTTVTVSIPFKRVPDSASELEMAQSDVLKDMNILLVDDDEMSLDIMATLLEGSNVRCVRARSGYEAMEVIFSFREKGEYFDMILLDYKMDGLDGIETAKQIQTSLSKAPKLLMVTAHQKHLLKNEIENSGIEDIMEKPFIPSHFINKLRNVMSGVVETQVEEEEEFTQFEDVNVLLCEDYLLNQEVASGMFEQFGIVPVIADNGMHGVEYLKSGRQFDLIFMDLQMPVMDGYEATRTIRADPQFDSIPIVALTADAMVEVVNRCLNVGMNDHLSKPIDFKSLHSVFLKWLPENKRSREKKIKLSAKNFINEGLARFGGKKDLYEKALIEFADGMPDKWPEFDYVANEGKDGMLRDIHKLKGVAGNLAVDDVYQYAAQFESSLRNNKPDKRVYDHLKYACNVFKNYTMEKIKKPEVAPTETGTTKELTTYLLQLEEALKNYDPNGSSQIVKDMKKKVWPMEESDMLNKLYTLTLGYDFDSALDMITNIIK